MFNNIMLREIIETKMSSQVGYLINGLKMRSKSLQFSSSQALIEIFKKNAGNTASQQVLLQVANMNRELDEFCLIFLNFIVSDSDSSKYLVRQKPFWERIKRLINSNCNEFNSTVAFSLTKDHNMPRRLDELLLAFIIRLCALPSLSMLKFCQIMLAKCNIEFFVLNNLDKYQGSALNVVELCTLECMQNQLMFSSNSVLMSKLILMLQTSQFLDAIKSLINIISGNECAVSELLKTLKTEFVFNRLLCNNPLEMPLILGFMMNILEFRLIENLDKYIPNILSLYLSLKIQSPQEKTSLFLLEIFLLWCCWYKLLPISLMQDHFAVENTLLGIGALVNMEKKRWSGIGKLSERIQIMLDE
eukprot:NODE_444_length_8544_cov_0.465127.p2 type:complete len:360 gc:universal NODE_444_length_8544_cov_0.465127:1725-646(-)